ncbi:uncharacterized protein TNCV_947731 [Trichonephila clavipes]|nr:uncharacterized protein TNCV_947731 [Trichonephila clavipes]
MIGMMEAGWSARRVARQLDHSDCVVRKCWDQWIREMSFNGDHAQDALHRPRRENHHIIRNADVQPNASSVTIQAQVEPSLGTLCLLSSHTKAPG